MANKAGMGLLLAGGAALALAASGKKKKTKSKSGIHQQGATVNGLADLMTGPIALRKAGSDITFKDFVKYPTEAASIHFKFPKDFANKEMAGKKVSAKMFVQGPNFGKVITEDGQEMELPGTENVRRLVINIKPAAAKKMFSEFRTRVIQSGDDYSMPSATLDSAVDAAASAAGGSAGNDEVRAGAELIAQLAYQSVWNSQG